MDLGGIIEVRVDKGEPRVCAVCSGAITGLWSEYPDGRLLHLECDGLSPAQIHEILCGFPGEDGGKA